MDTNDLLSYGFAAVPYVVVVTVAVDAIRPAVPKLPSTRRQELS